VVVLDQGHSNGVIKPWHARDDPLEQLTRQDRARRPETYAKRRRRTRSSTARTRTSSAWCESPGDRPSVAPGGTCPERHGVLHGAQLAEADVFPGAGRTRWL
jgi:hypothetical protein